MKERILYVEDDESLSFITKDQLEMEGYDVTHSPNGKEGWSAFRKAEFDLCLLDVMLPQMDGFELYREIKKVDRKAKICFLTASELYYENFRKEKFAALDKELFIIKPISNAELLKKIDFILKVPDT